MPSPYDHSYPPKVAITVEPIDIEGQGKVSFVEPSGIEGVSTGPVDSRKIAKSKPFGTPPVVYTVQPKSGKTWATVETNADLDWSTE